jgi:hypothetical protein
MKFPNLLSVLLTLGTAHALTIDAVYFAQTHVLKPDNPKFGLVGNRDALIKAHVVDLGTPAAPPVSATLTLGGQTLVLPMTGPATLPASIADGLGVVQHSSANSFTAVIPAEWVKPGLAVNVTAGAATVNFANLKIGAPTKVIMRMFDIHYFGQTTGDYPAGWKEELEAKWPLSQLELRRLPNVVFPELVIPTRAGLPAVRIKSPADYLAQTGQSFDGEQAAALAWNGALKRAGGRSGRLNLYYLNIYGANAGGQAGGFSGVGNGTSQGILHHELGHALSLPHWGDSAAYPYKGAMHGIAAPPNYNETHAGPAWAFDLPSLSFIPPTAQTNNVGGNPAGTYKVDPMQGGGTGYQEPGYLMNHFSDYSMNQMRNYLEGHVLVWNDTLGSYASWNQSAAAYVSAVSNNGVQYPIERDVPVITIMASVSGASPNVNMVYPPIGPYTAGLIRLFDPTVAADRSAAQSIFAPANGCDVSLRIIQGGVQKNYLLAASWEPSADPLSGGSLITEAVNLPASDGEVTLAELLLTPNAEVNGLPINPQILSTWAPITPDPATFELAPTAGSSSAITMRATQGTSTGDPVEYLFTETTGNPGGTSSAWQSSRSYTDIGLQSATTYAYIVKMRAGPYTGRSSAAAYETTNPTGLEGTITVNSTRQFSLQASSGLKAVTGLATFDAAGADKLVVVVSTEHGYNNGEGYVNEIRYNGIPLTEVVQEDAGTARGTAAMFYLDNPGAIGSGTIEVSAANPNGGIGAAYALSGTAAGFGATNSSTGSSVTSVSLTTSGDNVLVIAAIDNAGNSNGAGTPTVLPPLIPVSSGVWGSQWGCHASGFQKVATPSTITPTFSTNTGTGYSINIIAAEFFAEPVNSDNTPPTLISTNFVDNKTGGPITISNPVTYTVTFSEPIKASTITPSDFENGGSPAATINSVSPTPNASVFEVSVTPGGSGTLRLQVKAGANLEDLAGNALNTATPIADDTIITVNPVAPPPTGTITVDGFTPWDKTTDPGTFNASASDKLVVAVAGEHHFSGYTTGNVTAITYNGQPLIKAVEESPASSTNQTTADIWYLDTPGSYPGPGTIDVSFTGNNWVVTAIGLSGTKPGFGATNHISGAASVGLTTTAANSMVVAVLGSGGSGNTALLVNGNEPLTTIEKHKISTYAGITTAYASIGSPGSQTFSFNTSATDVVTIAAEFLATEPSNTYATWTTGPFQGTLGNTNTALDFDGGGLQTGIEWVVGGDPTKSSDDAGLAPTLDITSDPAYFIFTYRRTDAAHSDSNTTIAAQYGINLGGWITASHDGDNIIITESNDSYATGVDKVEVKIKKSLATNDQLFARLNVGLPP